MTGNFRFSDKHFPANGKPPPVFYTWKDRERRAAWWLESNRRKELGNGADPDTSSLADEIKAAERKHRRRTGNGAGEPPQDGQNPPYGVAEDTADGAESSKTGGDPDRAKHDSKSDKEAFLRLSKLSRAEYDRVRVKEAEALGIRIATLDQEVEVLRPRVEDEAQGSDLVLYEPEPWAYPVDGAALLSDLTGSIQTYVILSPAMAQTVALWVLASYAFMAFRIFPRLLIKAPNSECGKSTLRDVVAALVNKALSIDNASTPFIFRVIELSKPTLLIDEADSFIKDNEERRGIVNSGHHKTGSVGRIVGEELKPKTFSTYCPMVIATIGNLPITIEPHSRQGAETTE